MSAFRSMQWLRTRGTPARLRVLALLIAFVFGMIVGRDAVLVHQIQELRANAESAVTEAAEDETPEIDETRPTRPTVRPSGINKRTAWNPFDEPDDDDETDDDSDCLAANAILSPPVDPAALLGEAVFLARAEEVAESPLESRVVVPDHAPRGPPAHAT